jgi:hypothetical protein
MLDDWLDVRCRHVPVQVSRLDSCSCSMCRPEGRRHIPARRQPPQRSEIHRPAHGAGQGSVADERPAEGVVFAGLRRGRPRASPASRAPTTGAPTTEVPLRHAVDGSTASRAPTTGAPTTAPANPAESAAQVALYHTLGALPEPESTHRFC